MNDLTVMSDAELDIQVSHLRERERMFETETGKKKVAGEMLKLLGMIEKCGYQIKDAEKKAVAKIWANKLKDQIVRLGYKGVQEAAVLWVQDDGNEYRVFPKVAWIYDKCSEIEGDPRVEKGRRDQKRREAKLEEESKAEFEKWRRDNPELAAAAEKRMKELFSK